MIHPVEQTDEAIAVAAQLDSLVFLPLYDRYAKRVERYIQARIGRAPEAEDLASTTFTQALTRIRTFDPERGAFAVWLFAIARNVVNMYFRRHRADATGVTLVEPASTAPTPEEAALQQEQRGALEAALYELTPDQRDALALRYLADLSFAEVATTLGKSEAAAKMLVRRGVDALRRQLESQD